MDFDSLKSQVTSLSLYDIKAGFRKAQNGGCPFASTRNPSTQLTFQPS